MRSKLVVANLPRRLWGTDAGRARWCRRLRAVVLAAAALAVTGCLELPEPRAEFAVPVDTTDPDELRQLASFADLGICTEEGWSGTVVNAAASDIAGTVEVVFFGQGSEELGGGSAHIAISSESEAAFTVVPDPAIDGVALTCTIDIIDITPSKGWN